MVYPSARMDLVGDYNAAASASQGLRRSASFRAKPEVEPDRLAR